MTDNTGIKPIRNKILEPNHVFGLLFKEGWIFGRVLMRTMMKYKPYYVIDANGAAVNISADTYATQGALRFRDPRNTQYDILYLDGYVGHNGLPWIMHGSWGVDPDMIRMYVRIPETKNIPYQPQNIDPVVPANGDDVGYLSSLESPYEEPSDFMEVVIPPNIHVSGEYYNLDTRTQHTHQPVLNIYFATYWFEVLNRSMDANLITAIANRTRPASFFTAGAAYDPLSLPTEMQRQWGGQAPMTLAEAKRLGGQ